MNEKTTGKCPNCGASIETEICPYCHNNTGFDTASANMEYPVMNCKEATINYWSTWFPLIFAIGFAFFGIFILMLHSFILILQGEKNIDPIIIVGIVFCIVSIIFFIISIGTIIRNILIKVKGKEIEATVYGYTDDNMMINASYAQIIKLLVTMDGEKRFIFYQLKDTKKPYKINSKIKILFYKDIFMIKEDKKYYFE